MRAPRIAGGQFPAPDGQHALKRNSACGHPAPPPFLPPAIPPTTPFPILTSHAAAKQMRRGCPNCRATYNSISNRLAIPRVVNATGIICYRCRGDIHPGELAHKCALPSDQCAAYWHISSRCPATGIAPVLSKVPRGCPACATRMREAIDIRARR